MTSIHYSFLTFTLSTAFCFMGFVSAQDTVTIPMAAYKDLLKRVESLEKKVNSPGVTGAGFEAPISRQAEFSAAKKNKAIEAKGVALPSGKEIAARRTGKIFATYEPVYAKPVYTNNAAFYVHDNISGIPENATLHEFKYDLEASHRFELGYLNPSSQLGWRVRYWNFDPGSNARSADDVDVKLGVADDPDIALDTTSANDNDFVIATAGTDLDVFDLETFREGCFFGEELTIGAGVRYAEVQHFYDGQDFDPDTGTYQTRLTANHRFQGAGPTFFVQGQRPILGSNFSFDFGTRGSVLFGGSRARWERFDRQTVRGSVPGDVIDHGENTRFIPVGEVRLGVSYERDLNCGRAVQLGTGFEGQYWFNGGVPMNAGQDGATDSDHITSPFSQDFGVMGVYFRAGYFF